MRASAGDRIVTASGVVGGQVRDGVVVEARGRDGAPPYVVRWSDTGEETLVFPGPDTRVTEHADGSTANGTRPGDATNGVAPGGGAHGEQRRTLSWQVQVTLVESSGSTTAEATVIGPVSGTLRAVGHARKAPDDPEVPQIGDELAAARALRRLAYRLLEVAEHEIGASTGQNVRVHD